ncbi:MAG: hypothetical protein KAK00_03110 [Nanoarchaeota archaeon]|nr:hypothetical protein [Nanoarchaeota archaeon]
MNKPKSKKEEKKISVFCMMCLKVTEIPRDEHGGAGHCEHCNAFITYNID